MYRLLLTNRSQKDLDRLHGSTWARVRDALLALREDPRPSDFKKLRGGSHTYRIRIGDYRAICDVDDENQTVTVLRVRHRREVYRNFSL